MLVYYDFFLQVIALLPLYALLRRLYGFCIGYTLTIQHNNTDNSNQSDAKKDINFCTGKSLSSLGSCNHTFVTDCKNKHLGSGDISSAAPGAARTLSINEFPPNLQVVNRGWGSLPEALRAEIVLIVETKEINGYGRGKFI